MDTALSAFPKLYGSYNRSESKEICHEEICHEQITDELMEIFCIYPKIRSLFIKSIEKAKKKNPDRMTNPAQSLSEYLDYLDWCAKPLPWTMKPFTVRSTVFERIDQGLEYFYFILDQPLEELKGMGYYYNSLQYVEPVAEWMRRYAKKWGRFLSSEESWNDSFLKMVLNEPRFNMDKGWYEDQSNWHSFNDFFSRKLASPSVRPVDHRDDDSVVVSPADAMPQGVWDIDESSNIIGDNGVLIKSNHFYSACQLIGSGSRYSDEFASGKLTHTFLNVDDYHRYHFPVSGTIKEVRMIPAHDAAGGITVWDEKAGKYDLDSTEPGWQWIETRGCVIIDMGEHGLAAILPIGMSQVSSVNFTDNVRVGEKVKKGDDLGYFLFGGSDIVMIFQQMSDFRFICPLSEKGGYCHMYMGQRYGTFRR